MQNFGFYLTKNTVFFQNKDNRLMLYEYWAPITIYCENNRNSKQSTKNLYSFVLNLAVRTVTSSFKALVRSICYAT
jgi:hypothetical protein